MSFSPLLQELMTQLRCLPGVGPKTAQRMAFHLLERDRHGAIQLAGALKLAAEQMTYCKRCRILCEQEICEICGDSKRNAALLCVVESPADVYALDQATGYDGLYFALRGHLSPLDGIGPDEIGIDLLAKRFADDNIKEVILATNPTVEGDATAHYIAEMAKDKGIQVSRIAFGVPVGGELEYADGGTLAHAFLGRHTV